MSIGNPLAPPSLRLDLDLLEKIILILFFSFFAARMLGALLETGAFINFMFLVNETVILIFILLRRRAITISHNPTDWAIGFGGTLLPLLIIPVSGEPLLPASICGVLMLSGFVVHLVAKFTLRRSFGVVAANRGVKQSGIYRLVRHPMYAGYLLTQLSVLLAGPNLHNVVVIGLGWAFQIARIVAEERILKEDPSYRELMLRTPYRIIPGVF
jgi:protein-S-isoprenylcysteine O-methyltransferase Ste14